MQADGLDIHYRIDGTGPETLVLINGVGDDLEGWAFQREDFAAAGLRALTFDNRGCGSSLTRRSRHGDLVAAKEAIPGTPVVANTGAKAETLADIFVVAGPPRRARPA